jgi:N-methylhydantoinase B
LIGFAVALAHHADVGGRVPGTNACDNTDIFQEGLRLPWLRLYSKGKPMADLFTVIRSNVRVPSMTLGDLSAQVAACHVGERGLVDLADRYGHDGLLKLMAGLLDHTEQLARAAIERWPDGTASFVDYLDSDGIEVNEVAIRAEVSIRGSDITVDLSDSDKMVRGALNATHSFTEASVYQAVMAAIPSDLPYTAGAFRPITVITKPGTIANVVMPGASSMRGVTGFRIFDAVNGALAQLIPSRIPAAGEGGNSLMVFSGNDLNGEEFVFYELVVGAWGGRPTADGNDGLCNPCATVANIPVEVAESDFPVLIERYGLVADSGGPGRFRGGLAVERSWRMLVPVSLAVRSDRQIHAPYGLAGGHSGGRSRNLLTRNGDRTRRMPPMFTTTITSGDRYHHVTPGGGGWGDPLEHDPELLAVDVGNEKVSRRAARKEYGVVLNRDGTVNDVKTATLRTKLRARRNGTSGSESGDHPVHRGERVVVAPTSQDPG